MSPIVKGVLIFVALLGAVLAMSASAPSATLNLLLPPGSHVLAEGIAYGPLPRQRLDVYTPASKAPPGGWPVVVFFYGGSWNRGERADYRFVGEALASHGVLALVADYRLYPEVRYPEFLHDGAAALGFGLDNARRLGGDARRVFVMGHSAGAYNAAMLALDARWLAGSGHAPSELAGWIGLAGPYDFLPITNPDARPVFFHPDYPPGTQPLEHAGAGAPRSLIAAAASDTLVNPQRSSTALAARLRESGVDATLHLYARVDHMSLLGSLARPLRWLAPTLSDLLAFVGADAP